VPFSLYFDIRKCADLAVYLCRLGGSPEPNDWTTHRSHNRLLNEGPSLTPGLMTMTIQSSLHVL
jgi:hypothetical protein